MDAASRQRLEGQLRELVTRGDTAAAMTAALHGYGGELYGFLVGLTRDGEQATELFASTSEKLWRGLPGFRWESSFRVWAYAIARNEFRYWRRGRKPQVPLSQTPELADAVRTATATFRRTEAKDGLAALRAELDPEDQMLLGLRVDRGLEWNEIAAILAEEGEGAPAAPALRKRFERLVKRLREQARARGLLPGADG